MKKVNPAPKEAGFTFYALSISAILLGKREKQSRMTGIVADNHIMHFLIFRYQTLPFS